MNQYYGHIRYVYIYIKIYFHIIIPRLSHWYPIESPCFQVARIEVGTALGSAAAVSSAATGAGVAPGGPRATAVEADTEARHDP